MLWLLLLRMKSHSPCTIMYLLSFCIYFIMIILTLPVSSGSCNCPLSWIYIQLVSRSSREQTPHCISKEGECNKMNNYITLHYIKKINVPIKKRKVRKPEKLWQKAACISGAKSTEKWSFLYHLFVVVVVFVCVHVFSIKMNK